MDTSIENIDKAIDNFERRSPHTENLPAEVESNNPGAMIRLAISRGADLDKLERLMELQERYEYNESKKLFNKAVSEFKAHAPTIFKDRDNSQYKSKYVSEANLMNTTNPELSKYGLNARFNLEQNDNIGVTCTLTHEAGYSESTSMSAPADSSGSKNPIQQIKSTVTYLRKMTFEAIVGIATTDPESDDDGNVAGTETIDEYQLSRITDLINDLKESEEAKRATLKFCGVEKLNLIPKSKVNDIYKALIARKAREQNEN